MISPDGQVTCLSGRPILPLAQHCVHELDELRNYGGEPYVVVPLVPIVSFQKTRADQGM